MNNLLITDMFTSIHLLYFYLFSSDGEAIQGGDSRFGQPSSSLYWLDDVKCTGVETTIADCDHAGWGTHNCGISEAAKVICRSIF